MRRQVTDYYCDYCKKKIDVNNPIKLIAPPIRIKMVTRKNSCDIEDVDICQECLDRLKEFVKTIPYYDNGQIYEEVE